MKKAKTEEVKVFTVSRKRWLRGTGEGMLRTSSGKMCCLGFVGRQCGIPAAGLAGHGAPFDLPKVSAQRYPKGVDWEGFIHINDARSTSDKEKEDGLKAEARRWGFKMRFVP